MHLSMTVTVPAPADEPYFIVDECDVFSNENPDENDSASILAMTATKRFCSSYILVNSPYPLEMDTYRSPHHMKAKSAGKPVYALPLVLFSDDTSSNKSKKWHKFISWYLKLAGLSGQTSSKIWESLLQRSFYC
ncbi:hypothetical protein EMCRGX_G015550 [Ephydatia muelleri]